VSTLPPIDDSVLPADVRRGTEADQTRYKTALSFERELVSQLTQQLAESASAGAEEDSSSGASSTYEQMLPGVLADSVMQSGGLGLARTIAASMKENGQ
jgi:Rod binding domain-containing protein